jgi:hypothetical protein
VTHDCCALGDGDGDEVFAFGFIHSKPFAGDGAKDQVIDRLHGVLPEQASE